MPVHVETNTQPGTSGSITISSHTVSGTNPTLIVKVEYKQNSPGSITSVFWNGTEELTMLGTEANGGDANTSLWYLAAPTATTANVVVTFTASRRAVASASTYSDVDQTNPFRAAAFNSATGTDATPTVDVVANSGEMVVDSMCQVSSGPDTATADHTQRHNDSATGGGTDTRGAGQEKSSAGATESMGWSMAGSEDWSIVAAPLQSPAGATVQGQVTASQAELTYDTKLGHATASQAELTYDPKLGQATAVQAELTYINIKGHVTAVQGELTYDPKLGHVTAVQGELVYDPKLGHVTAVQGDLTYIQLKGHVTAVQAELVYDPKLGQVTAVQGELVYDPKLGHVTAVQSELVYIPLGAVLGQVTAVQAELIYDPKLGHVTAVQGELVYDPKLAHVTAAQSELTYDPKLAHVTAVQGELIYDIKTGRVYALQGDLTYDTKLAQAIAAQAELIYDPKTGRVFAVQSNILYSTGLEKATPQEVIDLFLDTNDVTNLKVGR